MGITGLLPLLKSISKRIHIKQYAGRRVAIDAYSWLHKGIYGSALDLYLQNPTTKYIEYCVSRAKLLLNYKVKPILVFDGGSLPMKDGKEKQRKE
jgi:exonuclease 1